MNITKHIPTTVLLIEDSPTDVRLIREKLSDTSSDSFHIITAPTLSRGLELLSNNSVDVVLLDLGLPDSQGLDTFHAVYAQAPALPVIILTVSDDETLGRQAVQEGAQRFLSKDVLTLGEPYDGIFTRMIRYAIEQKRTEAVLTQRERQYRQLVETANIIILRANPQLAITYCNDYTLKLLGYTAEEFIGKPVVGTLLPPTESTGRDLAQMARDILEHPERYEHNRNEVITKDGRRLLIEWTNSPQYDDAGNYAGVLSTGIDITERERVRHVSTLNDILHVINEAPDLPSLYDRALTTAIEQLHFDSGMIATETEKGYLCVQRAHNLSPAFVQALNRVHVDEFPAARTIYREGELIVAEDVPPSSITARYSTHEAAVAIPFYSEGTVVGHIAFYAERPRSFTTEDRQLFTAIGLEFGTAVAKLTAKAKAEEYARQQYVLARIITASNEASDLQSLAQTVVDHIIDLAQFDAGTLSLLNKAKSVTELQYARGLSPSSVSKRARLRIDEPHLAVVYRDCQSLPDTTIMPSDVLTHEHKAAAAAFPIVTHERVIGHISIARAGERALKKEEIALLTAIGQELGSVITRMQAQEALTYELAITDTITRLTPPLLFPSLDFDGLMLDILENAKRLTGSAHGFISLIDPRTKDVISYGHTRMMLDECAIPEAQRPVRFPISPNGRYHGLWAHALNERQGFFTNAPAEHPAATGAPEGHAMLKQFLAVPALISDEVVGEIALANPGRAYTDRDVAVVGRLAEELFSLAVMRMRAEERLRASSLYARSLIEASLDPLVTISAEGAITDVNKATEEVTGRSREELIGSDFSDYFTEPEKARAGYKQVFTDGFVRDYPLAIRHKSGRVTDVLYNATVYRDKAGEIQGVFAAARDITDRKRAEEELHRYSGQLEAIVEERTAQLKNAERLAGIGETAAMIGHDLRNPLQGLQYIVDLQKLRFERIPPERRSTKDWQKEQTLFDHISEQVFYMDKIVADLQDYARPLDPEREALSVRTLVDDVLQSLPHADTKVDVHADLPDLTIKAEPHLMHRVFSNLFLNALQAMPDGGTLTISATTADGSVAISVRDTGIGIPANLRDKIFSPLTTGKAKGTGLGLAVVKRIVEAHDGTITFESEEGKGTTFTLTLPYHP